ncbi:hypothetical protein AQ436_00190 [Arthrobacter sp. EpRS66]|nr:hypothetical protein AQ436_00190 [Arthrobacter sp. EpRS66]
MNVLEGQLDALTLLTEIESMPAVTFTMYRTENYVYGCPCGFCGRDAKPYHPEGYFSAGTQFAVCSRCDGKRKPPRNEWKLIA